MDAQLGLEGKTISKIEFERGMLVLTMTDGTKLELSSPVGDIVVARVNPERG